MKCEASVQNPEDGTLQYLWVSLYRTGTARPVGTCNGLNGGWMQIFFLATLVLLLRSNLCLFMLALQTFGSYGAL